VSIDFGTGVARRLCEGLRHPARINVTVTWIEHGRAVVRSFNQGIKSLRFDKIDEIQCQSEMARLCSFGVKKLDFSIAYGEIKAPSLVDTTREAGGTLDLAVYLNGVVLKRRDVWITIQRMHSTSRVPRRARSEFGAFQQHNIPHPELGKVIKHTASNNAPANDDDSCVRFHAALDERSAALLLDRMTNA
jgi:hypothetical protein